MWEISVADAPTNKFGGTRSGRFVPRRVDTPEQIAAFAATYDWSPFVKCDDGTVRTSVLVFDFDHGLSIADALLT